MLYCLAVLSEGDLMLFNHRLFVFYLPETSSKLASMKPKTTEVMRGIIQQIRENFPFDMSEEELCADTCSHGCSLKLLEYIDQEITDWEQRLDQSEIPNFGDIQKLSKSSQKVYKVLQKNDLLLQR